MKRKIQWSSKQAVVVALILATGLTLAASAFAETESTPGTVNINTADSVQLTTLPGIGQSKAQAIVKYRTEHGPFPTVDSLADVRGIGMKLLKKIRPFITTINQ